MKRTILIAGLAAVTFLTNPWPRACAATNKLTVTLSDPAGGDPAREVLPDGSILVRLTSSQPVSGDVSGIFTEQSTQHFAPANEQGMVAITTLWRLETSAGALEGYYFGLRDRSPGGTRDTAQSGSVLTTTQAYAAYSQANITYRTTTASGSLRATVTIEPPFAVTNDFLGDVGPAQSGAGRVPFDAAPNADGSIFYFTALDENGIPGVFSVPPIGGTPATLVSAGLLVAPRGIAVSPTGLVYVADTRAGTDRSGAIFALLGGNRLVSLPGAEGFAPLGLEVSRQDGDDIVFFTGRDPRDGVVGVFRIRASQPALVTAVWKGAPLVQPDSVTIAADGVVYVSDRAAGGNGLGSVFSISDTTISRIATGFRPGTPAGIALDRAEARLYVSSLDSLQSTAQVLIIDLVTFASGTANKGIGQNHAAGGLHRAHDGNLFAWANPSSGGGEVYHVPIPPPKPPKKP